MKELIFQILDNPIQSITIIANIVIIESLLSVDNATVLATMVLDLPKNQRSKALKYGIFGAYIFRGFALVFASILIKIWWLKPIGGLYLLYLCYDFWILKPKLKIEGKKSTNKHESAFFKFTEGLIGNFWATILLIEIMDIAFSIENIFAAITFTPNIILVCFGVFIGILAMRFIAQWFVKLMEKFNFLENTAYIVICVLGLKLVLSACEHIFPKSILSEFLESEIADFSISVFTVAVFFVPIITSMLFNFPKHNNIE